MGHNTGIPRLVCDGRSCKAPHVVCGADKVGSRVRAFEYRVFFLACVWSLAKPKEFPAAWVRVAAARTSRRTEGEHKAKAVAEEEEGAG